MNRSSQLSPEGKRAAAVGEERAMEGGIDPLLLRGVHQAADLSVEIAHRIQALEKKMIATGCADADRKALIELRSGALKFQDNICNLAADGRKRGLLLTDDKMETGGGSTGRSDGESLQQQQHRSSESEIKHEKSAALGAFSPPTPVAVGDSPLGFLGLGPGQDVIEPQDRIIGNSDDKIMEETVQRLAGAIMLKYGAEAPDLARILEVDETLEAETEAEKTRKEAEVALSFGFNLELLGKHVDDLQRELWGIVSSFSPENRDVLRSMSMLAREPCLHGVAKLQWISEHISMLRRMDPDLDSQVKSTMLKLKSESYLSSLKKIEETSGGERVAVDATTFAAYRLCWERTWGNGCSFENQTLLSPMQFTHFKPSRVPVDAVAGSTLQIYSIKVSLKGSALTWPLDVYGVVTARDAVDRQRNPVFILTRNGSQQVTQNNPFLHLTGPVRAVVSMDTVYIETELKAKKGKRRSEDVALASTVINSFKDGDFSTTLADNEVCTIELSFEKLERSVQATIVSVVVKGKPGSGPFPYGGKILCSSLPCGSSGGIPSGQAVLFDSVDGGLIKDRDGHLDLNRRVLSVELGGELQFHMERYSQPGSPEKIDAQDLSFTPERWNMSTRESRHFDDGSVVEITIAWSLIPSKMLL